jgi:FkbM family methyltransferase
MKKLIKHLLTRHRRNPVMAKIGETSRRIYQCWENINFDIHENGESFVAETLGTIGGMGVIIDVGANKGEWALMASNRFNSKSIHAFEVIPSTYSICRERCRNIPNILTYNLGLGDHEGTQRFFYSDARSELASAVEGVHGGGLNETTVSTAITTGDKFCHANGIGRVDFLKIDVEGWEPKVLAGFSGLLEAKVIRIVQFEYNIVNIKTRFLLADFYELLSSYGFRLGKIYPNYVEFRPYAYAHEDFLGPNYLAVLNTETEAIAALSRAKV